MKMKEEHESLRELNEDVTVEEIIALSKGRGLIYANSEIYGGFANSWDYGPLGALIKNNLKQIWWNDFVQRNPLNVGLDSAILCNPKVWHTSGHVDTFSDPLVDCKSCKHRFRADKLVEESADCVDLSCIACPNCYEINWTDVRQFNLMFKTYQGTIEENKVEIYLRPETAQGIFTNFKNVLRTTRRKIPFGIGQIGKAFRNEITPGNFIFRTREFEQMELEFFCAPHEDEKWHEYWKEFCYNWLIGLGLSKEKLRMREHEKEELSHYSKATSDIEYKFPFGWGELLGIANRTDYDLKSHSESSNQRLEYDEPENGTKFIPYCIEPSVGLDRLMFSIILDAYKREKLDNEEQRVVLKLHPKISPFVVAILPLSKKLTTEARTLYENVYKVYSADFDDSGSIGKRYRRQDEIGTPLSVTYDFETLNDGCITVRNRDTMQQVRIQINNLNSYIKTFIESF